MQEAISNNSTTIFFCSGCLISPVDDEYKICIRCQEQRANRELIDRDHNRRNLIVFFAALIISLIVMSIAMTFLQVK